MKTALNVINTDAPKPDTSTLLPLDQYDLFVVSFSGGKDSLACVLRLIEAGVPKDKIELWHQDVDGHDGEPFMDWPCTPAYCRKIAQHLGVKIRFQWRVGGFLGEMLKENARSQPARFQLRDGTVAQAGGVKGKVSTRRLFPQTTADLSVRWCSAALKIDVAALAMNNDPALAAGRKASGRTLKVCYVSGERRQESAARSKYATVEKHRTSNASRRVDHWRNVIDMTEQEVWGIIERHKIVPHPAYYLGWGRVSCLACIFGNPDQWASVRKIAPQVFDRIARYEQEFGKTIKRSQGVDAQADAGTPYPQTDDANLVGLAMGTSYDAPVATDHWHMPAGAFSHCGGPT